MLQSITMFFVSISRDSMDTNFDEFVAIRDFGPVAAGDVVEGSIVSESFTTGDMVRYIITVRRDGSFTEDYFWPGPGFVDHRIISGPPTQSPPNFTISSLRGTGNQPVTNRLTWDEIIGEVATGYTNILGYEIEYSRQNGGGWIAVSPVLSSTTRAYDHVLSGAEASRGELRYRIRATNQITELENGPQGPWSEEVPPTIVSIDVNVDGWVGTDDMLMLYYSLALRDSLEVGTDRSSLTAGALAKTLFGGLLRSNEVTDTEVLAAWDRADLLAEFGESVIGGINATNPAVDANDALILYYAAAFRDLLGDGNSGGFESLRRDLLTMPSGLTSPTDEPLKAILRSANEFLAGQN